MEVAVAAAEEKEVAVAYAGARTGGVEETGEREKSSCGEDGRMDKVDGWISGLLGFPDGPFFNFGSTVLLFFFFY